jgi:hypothetical protein
MSNIKVIEWKGFWTVEDVKKNPNYLFVYGDNDQEKGCGGQAIIRNEPNVVGIPTKKKPSNEKDAFYSDKELYENKRKIIRAIWKVYLTSIDHDVPICKLKHYTAVVFPENGFGTGLADLPNKAPKTYKYLCRVVEKLKKLYKYDAGTGLLLLFNVAK